MPVGVPMPPVLITAARGDVRVPLWGPLKWAARMRALQKEPGGSSLHGGVGDVKTLERLEDVRGGTDGRSRDCDGGTDGQARGYVPVARTKPSPVVVYISEDGGHFGVEAEHFMDAARDYAFLISHTPAAN